MFTLHLRLFARVFLYVGCFLLFTLFACKDDEPSGDNTTPEPQAEKKDDETPKNEAPSSTTPPTPPANLSKREVAIRDYKAYLAMKADVNWTGNVDGCIAGDISQEAKAQVLARINYFRKQVGYIKKLTLGSADGHKKAQESALILRANNAVSHTPPRGWKCWTQRGYDASKGNVGVSHNPKFTPFYSVTRFMEEAGDHNKRVGHRGHFLSPSVDKIVVGATDRSITIWWKDSPVENSEGVYAYEPEFVAWPPVGYVIDDLAFDRWSLHVNNSATDASAATVDMVEVQTGRVINAPIVYSYLRHTVPFSTLVWEPEGIKMPSGTEDTEDITYKVTISNLRVEGEAKEYIYEVIIIDAGTTESPF